MPDPGLVLAGTKCEDEKVRLSHWSLNDYILSVFMCDAFIYDLSYIHLFQNTHWQNNSSLPQALVCVLPSTNVIFTFLSTYGKMCLLFWQQLMLVQQCLEQLAQQDSLMVTVAVASISLSTKAGSTEI